MREPASIDELLNDSPSEAESTGTVRYTRADRNTLVRSTRGDAADTTVRYTRLKGKRKKSHTPVKH